MYPATFDYCAPTSLEEASRLLSEDTDEREVKILAGGQSLLPLLRLRLVRPRLLVDLQRVPALTYLRGEINAVHVGAMVTHANLEESALLQQHWPWLAETAASIGDRQIRNLGTIGGSLAHADPSADWAAMALATEALVHLQGLHGQRSVPAEQFLVGAFETALAPTELVTGVTFVARDLPTGGAYEKFRHPASGYAVAGAAVVLSLNADGHLCNVRVGLTGVASIAYRARATEQALEGELPTAHALVTAATSAANGVDVLEDTFADAEFRIHLAHLVTERALATALHRARSQTAERSA